MSYELSTPLGKVIVVTDVADLPDLNPALLYMDAETTSFDDKQPAFDPYGTPARACGWAVTVDNDPRAWYVPLRHSAPVSKNLPLAPVVEWLRKLVTRSTKWINHNVKFDAHFLAADGVDFTCQLECTEVRARMLDSDRFNHQLKPLCREWCKLDMAEETELKTLLKALKTEDYGRAPIDIMARYAGADVLGNRQLAKFIDSQLDAELDMIAGIERRLTPVLFDMERRGVKVDRTECLKRNRNNLVRIIEIEDLIAKETGIELVDSNDGLFELFCNRLGLPVLGYTDNGAPSFDAELMGLYIGHPRVVTSPEKLRTVQIVAEHRRLSKLNDLYYSPFIEMSSRDGRVHGNYRQVIRTMRMAMGKPNLQQANSTAAEVIIPDDDRAFLLGDASQIEFRLIVHYCGIVSAIQAYQNNPRTDFHQFVTDMMLQILEGINRAAGKTINFMTAYGAGKKRIKTELMSNEAVMAALPKGLSPAEYELLCADFAEKAYNAYNRAFPEIKQTSSYAAQLCAMRGYIRNKYGQRRHLPPQASYKAFNSLVQGCAMAVTKERMTDISPRYNKWYRELDIHLVINKHDEVVADSPLEVAKQPETLTRFQTDLEACKVEFKVPLLWDTSWSAKSWADAKGD